MPNGVNPKG